LTNQPRIHALIALMLLDAARLPARVDSEGNILRLKEQDRALWNRKMIESGILQLGLAAAGDELTEYHIQAGIAACHDTAADYKSTDWRKILTLYDHWVALNDSPVIALNRAVAVANVNGPKAGLEATEAVRKSGQLDSYYLLYAVLGEFEFRQGDFDSAGDNFRKAIKLTDLRSEKVFLEKRLRDCEEKAR
jgi:predicted RNA polymerase sigma factor